MTCRWFTLALLLVAGQFQVHAQLGASPETDLEQHRLDDLREALNRQLQEEEIGCRQRFAVNDCLKTVQTRHREKLADIKRQEASLHDRERRQRAEEQRQQLEDRSRAREQQLQERSVVEGQPPGVERSREPAADSPSATQVPAKTTKPAAQSPSSEMREAHARKLRDAEDRRVARDKRMKEKAADKRPLALPTVP